MIITHFKYKQYQVFKGKVCCLSYLSSSVKIGQLALQRMAGPMVFPKINIPLSVFESTPEK